MTIAESIKRARAEKGLTQAELAKQLNVRQATISSWEKGVATPRDTAFAALADALEVGVEKLRYGSELTTGLRRVKVVGDVMAGNFRTALQYDEEDQSEIWVPNIPPRAYALISKGESMNLRYPEGTYLICLPVQEFETIKDKAGVIVHRSNAEGLWEATVKEYRVVDGKKYLWPRSDHPDHQSPIHFENGEQVEITAVVIGTYAPE